MLGGLIMAHGDDNGLRVPPRIAPIQAYVMIVKDGEGVAAEAAKLRDALRDAGIRVGFDDRVDTAFGRRAVDAELKGYPIRIEVGPRDLAAGNVVVVRRVDGSKTPTAIGDVVKTVAAALDADQQSLYDEALALRQSRTAEVATLDEALEAAGTGWARVPWSVVGVEGEAKANGVGVTVRCLTRADGSVPDSEDEPDLVAYLARAY
jgi:prolyl-tRNA synthetase